METSGDSPKKLSIKPKIKITTTPEVPKGESNVELIYKRMEQREHVLQRPNMYMGAVQSETDHMFVVAEETDDFDDIQEDENGKHDIIQKKITFVPALYKIFDEVIVNAGDHHVRMSEKIELQKNIKNGTAKPNPKISLDYVYHPVKNIIVNVDPVLGTIMVENDGDGIDVAFHNIEQMYIPQMIFCTLLTSGNYDQNEDRKVGGMNGMGAKLANIMSTEFIIETIDAHRKLYYKQICRNNLSVIEPPIIQKVPASAKPFTRFTFKPDFKRFGMTDLNSNDTIRLIKKRAYDIAGLSDGHYKVSYNGQEIVLKSFERYIDMYIGSRGNCRRQFLKSGNDWEIAVSASDGTPQQVSFVNKICTYNGGKHVRHVADNIAKKLLALITSKSTAKIQPTLQQLKDNMFIFINCSLVNPDFDNQTKDSLKTNVANFSSKCEITDDFIEKLAKPNMNIVNNAKKLAQFRADKDMSKSDGKSGSHAVRVPKTVDAIYAKGNVEQRQKCVLIFVEGLSAKTCLTSALGALDVDQQKYYGIMPLKGKIVNPKSKNDAIIEENSEVHKLKQMIGLKQGVDYSDPENRKKLRYGRIMIMTDADVDGDHIRGLIINLFHEYWHELLQIDGFVFSVLTPNVTIVQGKKTIKKFHSLVEYDTWKKSPESLTIGKWKPEYFKGLGSHTPDQAKEWFIENKTQDMSWSCEPFDDADPILKEIANRFTVEKIKPLKMKMKLKLKVKQPITDIKSDDEINDESESENDYQSETEDFETELKIEPTLDSLKTEKYVQQYIHHFTDSKKSLSDLAIQLAFSPKLADCRKGLINTYKKRLAEDNVNYAITDSNVMSYYDFITHKFVQFSADDIHRSIPSMVDGLKPVQRKVIYRCLDANIKSKIKVSQLAGQIAEHTDYHHGEVSMVGTIVKMAQDYVGSNNLNLLHPEGQFGSRIENGDDASADRYIHTFLCPFTEHIYNKNDTMLYKYNDNNGKPIEPVQFVPVIPMVLINGALGIGTGWSTAVPQFNPHEIIFNIRQYISGNPMYEMIPWFRGYRGRIEEVKKGRFLVRGRWTKISPTEIEIDELPVGSIFCKSFSDYKTFVESMIAGTPIPEQTNKNGRRKKPIKQILKDVECLINAEYIKCKLIFPTAESLNTAISDVDEFEMIFKLRTIINTGNMHLHDENGLIRNYSSPLEILESFCKVRLHYYDLRRNYLLSELDREITRLSEKIRFISYIFDPAHELKTHGVSYNRLLQLLEKYDFKKLAGPPKKQLANKIVDDVPDDEGGNEDETKTYNYLTSITIRHTTLEELQKLKNELQRFVDDKDSLTSKTPQNMWLDDLKVVSNGISTFEREWDMKYRALDSLSRSLQIIPSHLKVKVSGIKPKK